MLKTDSQNKASAAPRADGGMATLTGMWKKRQDHEVQPSHSYQAEEGDVIVADEGINNGPGGFLTPEEGGSGGAGETLVAAEAPISAENIAQQNSHPNVQKETAASMEIEKVVAMLLVFVVLVVTTTIPSLIEFVKLTNLVHVIALQVDKKRKRSGKTPEQTAALEELFARTAYPSTAEKQQCATAIGLQLEAVNNWFEKRRKQARASGQVMVKSHKTIEPQEQAISLSTDQECSKSKELDAARRKGWLDKIDADISALLTAAQDFTVLASMPCSTPVLQQPLPNDSKLAVALVGQTAPFSKLVEEQETIREAVSHSSVEAVRNQVLRLAVHRNYAIKQHTSKEIMRQSQSQQEGDPHSSASASMESGESSQHSDPNAETLWQWELKDIKVLPKPLRPVAAAIRKRAQKVGERLMALTHARNTISRVQPHGPLMLYKGAKAFETVANLSSISAFLDDLASEVNAAETKASAEIAAVNDIERLKREKEEEKERLKRNKEEERERLKKEKEEEKERLKREKEEERERLKEEAVSAKIAKKTGFKDKEELNKTANKFKSFFKASTPSTSDPNKQTPNQLLPHSSTVSAALGTTPHPPSFSTPMRIGLDGVMDEGLTSNYSEADIEAQWKSFVNRLRIARREKKEKPPSTIGLPPVWARHPGAVEAAAERLQRVIDSGTDPTAVKTWRRKFIWFPADSARPPYYGSWPAPGKEVGPRRPLGRDETLDYEVMSDIDWEEEPEGSSLSKADSEDEVMAEDDGINGGGDDDSFMVADGYLSADEGVELEEAEEEDMAVDSEFGGPGDGNYGFPTGQLEESSSTARKQAFGALQIQMERARRAGKPLVVLRDEPAHPLTGCIPGDPSLLPALAMEVILPAAKFWAPTVEDIMPTNGFAQTKKEKNLEEEQDNNAHTTKGKLCRKDALEELVPLLASYIENNATLKKPNLIEGFIQLQTHAQCKVPKKWVNEKISELAERSGGRWKLREAGPSTNPIVPSNQRLLVGMPGVVDKGLRVPETVEGTGDEFWLEVLSHIEEVDQNKPVSSIVSMLEGVFNKQCLVKLAHSIPAFVVSALILVAERTLVEKSSKPLAWKGLSWLREIVSTLVEASSCRANEVDGKSSSQRAWGDARCGPRSASLDELCQEPLLASVMHSAVSDSDLPLTVFNDICFLLTNLGTSAQWKDCKSSEEWAKLATVLRNKGMEAGMDREAFESVHRAIAIFEMDS